MASSKIQTHSTLYTFFMLMLFSSISIDSAHGARSILISISTVEQACSESRGFFEKDSCVSTLQSNPKIIASQTPFDLAINIIETGISSATDTLTYIENLLRGRDDNGLTQCKSGYSLAIMSFKSALTEVRDIKEYLTATYDLLIASTDDIQMCSNVTDEVILKGKKLVPIYGLSAYQVVEKL